MNVCLLPNKVPKFGVCRGDINFLHNNFKELKTINFNEEKVWKGNILMWWNVGTFELAINEYASKNVLKDVKIWWMSYIGR